MPSTINSTLRSLFTVIFFALTLSLALPAAALSTRSFSVTSPSTLSECNMAKFTWRNAVAPVFITVIPEGKSRESLVDERVKVRLGNRAAWKVDMVAGSIVTFAVEDSAGHIETIGPMIVQPGWTECLLDDDLDLEASVQDVNEVEGSASFVNQS